MKLSEVKKYIIENYEQGHWSTLKNDLTYRINKLSEPEQRELVHYRDYNLQYILNPSKELQLEMVKKDGLNIKYISNPSEEVQLEAVKENGYAIEYIENPSEAVQLEAVKEVIGAINDIKKPTEKVLKYILNKDFYRIRSILRYIEDDLNEE